MYRTEGVRKRIWGCFPSSALERGRDGGTSLLHGVVPAKNLTFCGTSGQLLAKRMKSDVQRELEHLERRCLARPPTTRFDVAAFWKTAADRAEDALSTASPESGVAWPRVYVYDTLPDFANDANLSGLSDSSVWGRSIGTPGACSRRDGACSTAPGVYDTNHYSLALVLLWRVWNSPRYRTCDPEQADLFIVPLLPSPKRGLKLQQECAALHERGFDVSAHLPHLNVRTARKHLLVLAKEHYEGYTCDGWWVNPRGLLRRAMRLAYSQIQPAAIRADEYIHEWVPEIHKQMPSRSLFELVNHSYPNLVSAPYTSSVHWVAAAGSAPRRGARRAGACPRAHGSGNGAGSYASELRSAIAENVGPPWASSKPRRIFMLFLGGTQHGDINVRHAIRRSCGAPSFNLSEYRPSMSVPAPSSTCAFLKYTPERTFLKAQSTFCLEPGGDSPFRRSIADDLLFGCIPVAFSRLLDNAYPWVWDGWREASLVVIPRQQFLDGDIDLVALLSSIPPALLRRMQETIARNGRKFQASLEDDPGDLVHSLLVGAVRASSEPLRSSAVAVPSLREQLRDVPVDYTDSALIAASNDCTEPIQPAAPVRPPRCEAYGWARRARPARVFDLFTYYDEIDVLEARLHELNATVDVFVIAEANVTYKHGRGKPSHLRREMHRVAPFAHKIVHVWAGVHCPDWFWVCEDYQREMLLDGFLRAGGTDDDVVLVSDADEVPRPEAVAALKHCDFEPPGLGHSRLLRLHGAHYFYSLHCERTDHQWPFVAAATGRFARTYGPMQMRRPYSSTRPRKVAKGRKGGGAAAATTTQPRMPYRLPTLSVSCRSHAGGASWSPTPSLHLYRKRVGETCPPHSVEEFALPNSTWHFSYFGSAEHYRAKMFTANVAESKWGASTSRGEGLPYDAFLRYALKCEFPWKSSWRTAARREVPADAPSYVLRNPCRMRTFYGWAPIPGGNDWHRQRAARLDGSPWA